MMNVTLSSLLATTYLNAQQMSNVTIVLLYTAVLVVVTALISLRHTNPDPMLAGRRMPWWLVAASLVGTNISSIAFLGYPSRGFALDFDFLAGQVVGEALGVLFAIIFFISFLRNSRDASIYTLLGDRFGYWASVYGSVSFIAYSLFRMGIITCLVAQAVHMISGADALGVILLCGTIVIFYTYMSGIEGVMWTDLFQVLFLLAAGIAALVFAFTLMPADFMWKDLPKNPVLQGDLLTMKPEYYMLFITCLYHSFSNFYFYSSNQGIAQRYLVAKSTAHAKWGALVGGFIAPSSIALFFIIGLFLFMFYQASPHLMIEGFNAEGVFAYFIANQFPNGLKGLAIVGILAAAMSTIDTGLNSSSTVLICNLYEPIKRATRYQSLSAPQILRTSSVLFGIAGIIVAYFIYLHGEGILSLFWKGCGIINTGVFGLFLLMRFTKKAGKKAGIITVSGSMLVASWITFTSGLDLKWASPFHYFLTLPIASTLGLALGWCASYFINEAPKAPQPSSTQMMPQEARKQLKQRRKNTQRNIFADSVRPKPWYQLYALVAIAIEVALLVEHQRLGLQFMDLKLIAISLACLLAAVALPYAVKNKTSKAYIALNLALLGVALPLLGCLVMFGHPQGFIFSGFYLGTLWALGTMVGWTMLGLASMIATGLGAQLSVILYAQAGVPDHWVFVAMGALGIFTYFAMEAAKEHVAKENTLTCVHDILDKIYQKFLQPGIDSTLTNPTDFRFAFKSLMEATDIELMADATTISIQKTLNTVLQSLPKKLLKSIQVIDSEDIKIHGSLENFEYALHHLLDNALYYIQQGTAHTITITLNPKAKTLTIANDGPKIPAEELPYLFDLGFSSGKIGFGLGLAYCKRILESMRGYIELSSNRDTAVAFTLHF